jgi:hypothetical protein
MNTENNKIIAAFLGQDKNTALFYFPQFKNIEFKYGEYIACEHFSESQLKFHSDWNWLMEVVEKIESLGFVFSIKINWVKITKDRVAIIVRWEEDFNKKEAVYNACVEFIKWYNEQTK